MKQQKFDSEEALEIIAAMEAAQREAQKENMGARLKEIGYELQGLMETHPEEYWEAAVTMDPMPTLIPRRPSPQKAWRKKHKGKGILFKGKQGSFFDPNTQLNKDVIKAWEGVKQLQYQMKDSDLPWAEELRNLPPLSEATGPQWEPWIALMLYILNNQQSEVNAHAAKNIKHRKESQKTNPTTADIRNLLTPEKGALTMLAKDLDRVKGPVY